MLVLLILPFVFYLSNAKDSRDHNAFDRAVVFISSPVQWLVVHSLDGIASVWNGYIALVGVEEENVELRLRVAGLEALLSTRIEQTRENERLKLLLRLRDRSADVEPVSARIIATAPTPLFRSVRIDRGSDDGVHLGAAVVNYQGVVGRVAAVSGGWSTVMLLVDANSSTDVLVQRTRARARVRGTGGDGELGVRVEYLTRTEDVEPEDILITSGVGSVFPKGLRVGRVVSVTRGAFGLYQEAWVEPSVDFRRIEEVMVIRRGWSRSTDYESQDDDPEPDIEATAEPGAASSSAADDGEPAAIDGGQEPSPGPLPAPDPDAGGGQERAEPTAEPPSPSSPEAG